MYPLSFDYLDGFSILVGGDFVIVGGHSVPLGSYAADALNIDEAYLRGASQLPAPSTITSLLYRIDK